MPPIPSFLKSPGILLCHRETITISPITRIWLDRSKNKKSNIVASFDDIKIGRDVEVMHGHENENTAIWVKIESM
jgi:hypothetical protein